MQTNLVFLIVTLYFCSCFTKADNFTSAYKKVPYQNGPKHQPKFLTFNTDDGELSVDLEFAVPFISIPVKKTVDAAMGLYQNKPIANVNVGSIFLAGAVVFGAAFVIPFVTSLFFKHILVNPAQRSDEPNENWRILTLIDQALIENNIDTTTCMQQGMCWLAKNARNKLNTGTASSQEKIFDGLATNYWVNQMIEGSAIQTAIQTGLENRNCVAQYNNCKISPNFVQIFAKKLVKYLNLNK